MWSASEDGTLRQHDFREGVLCPPSGTGNQDCRNILVSDSLSVTVDGWINCYVILIVYSIFMPLCDYSHHLILSMKMSIQKLLLG